MIAGDFNSWSRFDGVLTAVGMVVPAVFLPSFRCQYRVDSIMLGGKQCNN